LSPRKGYHFMRVLVAEDESIIRLGLKRMLQAMGYEVVTAVNGREALEMARRQPPDFAILDIKMPYTDGLQAAKALHKQRPLPILILTAFSERDLIEQAAELPIHGYLIKPIQPAELQAAIAVALNRFAEKEALAAETNRLAEKLAERKLVDKAKGRLISQGMSEEAAYQLLQKRARDGRISLGQAAEEVIGNW
jgi:two-component system, response regulator PdtaR